MNDQQIAALERKHEDDVACGEIETHHLASLARKTHSMGAILKAWGESTSKHLSTPISKVVHCKLYTTKTLITAADLLNDRVLPFLASTICRCYVSSLTEAHLRSSAAHAVKLNITITSCIILGDT